MIPRERVLLAMNYQQPQQVAVDFGGHRSSGIMAMAYKRLRDYLALPPRPIKVYDIPQQLAVIDDDVLERFHIDVIELGWHLYHEDGGWKPWRLPDGTECLIPEYIDMTRMDGAWVTRHTNGTPIAQQKDGVVYFEQTYWPLAEQPEEKLERLEEMFAYNMWTALPTPLGHIALDDHGLAQLAVYARRVRESEQRAIIGLFGGSLFETGQMLWGIENYMQALVLHPDLVHRFLDRMVEIYKRDLERFLRAVGQYIDIVLFSDDYGMQTGSLISPKMFRQFFKARHQELWQYAKKLAPVKVMLHSCGSIANLLPDMIEAGLDVVQPIQTSSKNMQPAALKAQFGKSIVLWGGGCNTQRVLGMGTPEEVRQNVSDNLDVLAPGGGFVFQQIHNIMANVPPENIVAMFDAVVEWNRLHAELPPSRERA